MGNTFTSSRKNKSLSYKKNKNNIKGKGNLPLSATGRHSVGILTKTKANYSSNNTNDIFYQLKNRTIYRESLNKTLKKKKLPAKAGRNSNMEDASNDIPNEFFLDYSRIIFDLFPYPDKIKGQAFCASNKIEDNDIIFEINNNNNICSSRHKNIKEEISIYDEIDSNEVNNINECLHNSSRNSNNESHYNNNNKNKHYYSKVDSKKKINFFENESFENGVKKQSEDLASAHTCKNKDPKRVKSFITALSKENTDDFLVKQNTLNNSNTAKLDKNKNETMDSNKENISPINPINPNTTKRICKNTKCRNFQKLHPPGLKEYLNKSHDSSSTKDVNNLNEKNHFNNKDSIPTGNVIFNNIENGCNPEVENGAANEVGKAHIYLNKYNKLEINNSFDTKNLYLDLMNEEKEIKETKEKAFEPKDYELKKKLILDDLSYIENGLIPINMGNGNNNDNNSNDMIANSSLILPSDLQTPIKNSSNNFNYDLQDSNLNSLVKILNKEHHLNTHSQQYNEKNGNDQGNRNMNKVASFNVIEVEGNIEEETEAENGMREKKDNINTYEMKANNLSLSKHSMSSTSSMVQSNIEICEYCKKEIFEDKYRIGENTHNSIQNNKLINTPTHKGSNAIADKIFNLTNTDSTKIKSSKDIEKEADNKRKLKENLELKYLRSPAELRKLFITKLICSNTWIPNRKQKNHNTIIIFDWDDTLLCTSFLTPNGIFFDNLRIDKIDMEKITKLESLAYSLLKSSIEKGDTFIITNAAPGWVEYSARRFYPKVVPLLDQINIISARGEYEKKHPGDSRQWKILTFLKILKVIDTSLVTNLICLGDSLIEMEAAHILASKFSQAYIKTVKFRENPSPEELYKQLQLISTQYELIFSTVKNLTIKVEKKAKNINKTNYTSFKNNQTNYDISQIRNSLPNQSLNSTITDLKKN